MTKQFQNAALRTFAFLLILAMTFSMLPAIHASGEEKRTADGLCYRIAEDEDGNTYVKITDYIGTASELVIPSEIQGLPVSSIKSSAFEGCNSLTSVTIPDSVTTMGYSVFEDCINLVCAVLPEGITTLDYTFKGCYNLADVKIPDSVTTIGSSVFSGCSSLASIIIPDNVTTIDCYAFEQCSSLTEIRISKSVTSLSPYAFLECGKLSAFLVDEENESFSALDGVLYNKDQTCLILAPGALSGSFTVPDGVTEIGCSAFSYLTKLTQINLPDTLTSIGDSAFRKISNLTRIIIPDSVTFIDEYAFYNCDALEEVILPRGITTIHEYTFSGCPALTQLQIPWSVKHIHDGAFSSCTSLTSIDIPTSVKRIGTDAFTNCTALERITFLGNAPVIDAEAFTRVTAECFYSDRYADWTPGVLIDYSGDLTWICSDDIHFHDYSVVVTPPTCLDWGSSTYTCACGYSYVGDPTFYTGHSMEQWAVHKPATCTLHGEERSNCSDCDYYESRVIERTAHSFADGICQVCGCDEASASRIPDVTAYSYTITPILSPFAYCLYVQTDNPDPRSFRLVDRDSALNQPDVQGQIRIPTDTGYRSTEVEPATYYISQRIYPDVVYEDPVIYRVSGGYIFHANTAYSDGGEFVLLQQTVVGDDILSDQFQDTEVVIPCQQLYTRNAYLVEQYTDPELSLFRNLDQVNSFLSRNSIYPRSVYDSNKPNAVQPYPMLVAPYWTELSLDPRYTSMFVEMQDGLLMMEVYPFILDSLGYPGTIAAVARLLDPDCTVETTSLHYQVKITSNGTSKIYGGAGRGGNDPLYSNRVNKVFTFNGSENCAVNSTIDNYRDTLLSYVSTVEEDNAPYMDLVEGDTFADTIRHCGSAWARVATEGLFGFGQSFSYLMWDGDSVRVLDDVWVDGRYVDDYETIYLGATFEEHPTADILLHDVTYTNYYGATVTGDVLYIYSSAWGEWRSYIAYTGGWFTEGMVPPEELILTPEEVAALDLDANTNKWPESSLIYDGTAFPGTPFALTSVSGVSLTESITLRAGEDAHLQLQVFPDDAYDKQVVWTISDTSIVRIVDYQDLTIRAYKEGIAQITATTVDGAYSAVCQVTVKKPADQVHCFTDVPKDAFYYEPVLWAVENGITNGTSATSFGPDDPCMRAHVVTFLWRAAGEPEPVSTVNPFVDVKETDFFYKAVLWAAENGVTNGLDATHFGPTAYCNRAQVVTFLHRAVGTPDPESQANPFTDVASGAFYEQAVLWAVENGITNGLSASAFGPDAVCNRAQIVTFLYRAFAN